MIIRIVQTLLGGRGTDWTWPKDWLHVPERQIYMWKTQILGWTFSLLHMHINDLKSWLDTWYDLDRVATATISCPAQNYTKLCQCTINLFEAIILEMGGNLILNRAYFSLNLLTLNKCILWASLLQMLRSNVSSNVPSSSNALLLQMHSFFKCALPREAQSLLVTIQVTASWSE